MGILKDSEVERMQGCPNETTQFNRRLPNWLLLAWHKEIDRRGFQRGVDGVCDTVMHGIVKSRELPGRDTISPEEWEEEKSGRLAELFEAVA